MGATTDRNAAYCNLPQWWEAGYTGKGITVLDCESLTSHGKKSRQRILDAAPDATVINGTINTGTKNGVVSYRVNVENLDGTRENVPIEELIERHNIRILSASWSPDPFKRQGETGKYITALQEKYDLCIFASSGNDGKRNLDFTDHLNSWMVGALNGSVTNIKKASYSNGGAGLDFADFTGEYSGTSFSAPYLAGKAALLLQRWPDMTRDDMYDYMQSHCLDLGETGEDDLFGHGLFILPDVGESPKEEEKDMEDPKITTTQVLVNGEIKTVRRVMVNNENFIRLRDMDDELGICEVDYDAARNLPIVRTK